MPIAPRIKRPNTGTSMFANCENVIERKLLVTYAYVARSIMPSPPAFLRQFFSSMPVAEPRAPNIR